METLKADVVVMGSGAAGLGAAIAAAENSAKVVVLEKRKVFGGISVTGMGIFAVESRLQRLKNVPYTRDEVFKLFMERTHWMADAKLVRAYIDKTASTIEWLEDMGVKFELLDVHTFPGCLNQTGHIVVTPEGLKLQGGISFHMIKAMKDRAEKLGVDVRLGTGVKQIVEDAKRRRVLAQSEGGGELEVSTKAVVVAAGGYVHNKKMMARYGGFELGKDFHIMHNIQLTGEGIEMAWKLGAVPDGMYVQLAGIHSGPSRQFSGTTYQGFMRPTTIIAAMQPYLWVNQHGVRFLDEGLGNGPYMANAVVRQKNRCCYNIFDADTRDHLEKDGVERVMYIMPSTTISNIDAEVKAAVAEGRDDVFMAGSIRELAGKIGVRPDALETTINDYNSSCEKGHDSRFAKNPKYLRPVRKPTFYAFRLTPGGYGTIGGIKINERAQAIDKENDPIPGLYAAGDCANGTHTYDYPLVYILWGSTLSFAINSGRIAGENAANYAKSVK